MVAEAAGGGLVVSGAVAFVLARFPERVPGRGPIRKAVLIAGAALVLVTVFLEVPAKMRSGAPGFGHWLLVATVFNAIRILALGVSIGIVARTLTTSQDHHCQSVRRELE